MQAPASVQESRSSKAKKQFRSELPNRKIQYRPPPPQRPRRAKAVGKKIEINEKVMFDYNKASIKVDSHELLKDVAAVMSEHQSIEKVRIEGHTDSDGTDEYNKKLSQDRADAVKAFLVQAGIDETKLEAVGHGEEKPIAPNDTAEGKEKNRRVEFNIAKGESSPSTRKPRPAKAPSGGR